MYSLSKYSLSKYFILALLCLLIVSSAAAQSTTVSGQVTDLAGQSWNNGTYTFQFIPNNNFPSSTYSWSGGFLNQTITGSLNATGGYSQSVPSNTSITPSLSQWRLQVCSGTTPVNCFTVTQTITGGSQTVNATPVPIVVPPGSGNTAYITSEVSPAAVGSQIYIIGTGLQICSTVVGGICTTWTGSGGGVAGGSFGASASSLYTFTSTPITLAPLGGDLLFSANMNINGTGTYTPGAGYSLVGSSQAVLGVEWGVAGIATSYSGPFNYSVNSGNWGGAIATFAPSGTPNLVQGRTVAAAASLAFLSNNGNGNLLVAAFRYNNGAPIQSVSDTRGNVWVLAGMRCFEGYALGAGDSNNLEIWFAMNSIAGPNTITPVYGVGNTGGIANYIGIGEFSGIALTNALVDYNFTGSTIGATSIPGPSTNLQYTINAINNKTGVVEFTGRDSALVFRNAINQVGNTPGLLLFKNGIYPGQTSTQETRGGQTNWYVWGTESPAGGQEGSWHIVCESFTQILYTSLQTNGCIHQVMPSAYAGPQPTSNTLSGFWQRPANGGTYAPAVFFVNGTVRIPDNKHTPSNSYDTFMAIYSSHINAVADTGFIALDQACSGLSAPSANINGFRSNQSQTDETYYDNTWVIGMNIAYNTLSNHPNGVNMHASCNLRAGIFNSISTIYGGSLLHFQDIHNAAGIQFGCGVPGMQWESRNMIVENLTSGVFGRTSNASETTPGNCTGTITVTTQAVGGFYLVPAFFDAGSGANFSVFEGARTYQQGLINPIAPPATTTQATIQTLASFTVVFNSSFTSAEGGIFLNNPGAVLEIYATGTTAANANNKTVQLNFGGTPIATITTTANAKTIRCSAHIRVGSVANTQKVAGECTDGTINNLSSTSPGINGSANIAIDLAATTPTIGDFTFNDWSIKYFGGR